MLVKLSNVISELFLPLIPAFSGLGRIKLLPSGCNWQLHEAMLGSLLGRIQVRNWTSEFLNIFFSIQ